MTKKPTEQVSSKRRGALYVVLSAVLFGLMPWLTMVALSDGSNFVSSACWRFVFGAVALLPVLLVSGSGLSKLRITARQALHLFGLSVLYAVTPLMLFASYPLVGTGSATTLHFVYPIATIVGMLVFTGARPTGRQVVCTLACVLGVACLHPMAGQVSLVGMALALVSGITYALYVILLGRGGLHKVSALTLTFWLCVMSGAELAVVSAVTGSFAVPEHAYGWAALLGVAVFCTVIAIALFQKGMFLCGEVESTMLSTLEPITALAVGVAVMGEQLNLLMMVGVVLILVATVAVAADAGDNDGASALQSGPPE